MIIANFEQGQRKKKVSDKLTQWNYGQVLRIQGLSLPTAVEIHFSLQENRGDCTNRIGVTKDGVTDVVIPDSMVENEGAYGKEYYIYAWVYLTDETSGWTEYEIILSVETRSKPEAFDTPEDAELFREAIAAVNEAADRAEEAGKSAEAWAHGHEDYPEREEDNAKHYAEKAKESAEQTDTDRKEVQGMRESVENTAMQVSEHLKQTEAYKEQAQRAAENALKSERNAKAFEQASEESLARAETAEGYAELYASQAEEYKNNAEKAEAVVRELGQKVAEDKLSVELVVADVNDAGQTQTERVQEEGDTQVANVQAVVEGIAQEETAQRILENSNLSIPFLEKIAENSGKAGSLNGFGLEKGVNDTVVITYTNPDTEILEGSATLPTNTTLQKIEIACEQMCESLKIIALQKGAEV